MRSQQDQIPTHQLDAEMALDSHGRVLRRPYFVTKEEHDREIHAQNKANVRLLMAQREKVQAAEQKAREAMELPLAIDFGPATLTFLPKTKIYARRRLHWVVRWLVRVAD